jgi:hypothetical protein
MRDAGATSPSDPSTWTDPKTKNKFTCQEVAEIRAHGLCTWCRKRGHRIADCRDKIKKAEN